MMSKQLNQLKWWASFLPLEHREKFIDSIEALAATPSPISEQKIREELKPCPFCGGEAELKQKGQNEITIKCKGCFVSRTQRVLQRSIEWLRIGMIEDWNKRAAAPSSGREGEERLIRSFLRFREEFNERERDKVRREQERLGGIIAWVPASDEQILAAYLSIPSAPKQEKTI